MIPYYILIGFPALITILYQCMKANHKFFYSKKAPITVFFVIWLIILVCRDISCGADLDNYEYYFHMSAGLSLKELLSGDILEPGYFLLSKCTSFFTDNYQVFLAVVAVLSTVPFMFFYKRESEYPYLTVLLFINVAPFVMFFSGLRQALAMVFVIPAWYFVKERKLIKFLLIVLLAMQFHQSAFIIIAMYPLYHLKITKKWLIWVIPAYAAVLLFNDSIFTFLVRFMGTRYEDRYGVTTETGAYAMLILFVIFAVFSYVIPDEAKLDKDTLAMRNYLLASVFLQMFAPVNSVAMRMNYYYLLFIPCLIPRIISIHKEGLYQITKLALAIMTIFFFVYYIVNIHTGADILQIYPYVPFWKG